ncbi:MAG TPA: hypothetical protein VGL13_16245 [Polyangiaceae bacterium]
MAAMVGLLAWGFVGLAHAQQAPPEPIPPDQTPQPPSNPPLPTPSTPSTEGPPPGSAMAPPPAGSEVTPPTAPAPAANPATPPTTEGQSTEKAKDKTPLLGLALGTPDTGTIPGRFRPSYGVAPISASDYKFDFHGYLMVPFRVATNTRAHAYTTQHTTVFHAPPLVPDDFDRFEHTGVLAQPWVQLGFSYGNSKAVGTIIIAARTVSNASGFFNPPNELGINDAFLTFKPDFKPVYMEINVGGFASRYGAMGDYDTGRYDTPIIARIGGVGENIRADIPLAPGLTLLAEQGIMSQLDKAPLGVEPAGWNDFADPNVGSTFGHHEHVGLALAKRGEVGLHYVDAFSRDDRTAPTTPNGSISVLGADVRLELAPYGRLYVAGAYTNADKSRSVSGVIRVLNTFGGPGLMTNYFGPNSNGTGKLATFGGQYDVSIGEIVRSPQPYSGFGPDVFVSVFGMATHVTSDDPDFDGVTKVKYGGEITYSALSWLALSTRYDRVVANTDDARQTFSVISPRIILRSDYNSQDQVTLQYSRWSYGSGVVVRTGYPPVGDPTVVPDENMLQLTANLWW